MGERLEELTAQLRVSGKPLGGWPIGDTLHYRLCRWMCFS